MTKEQWLAIKNHDADYDGRFFYAVKPAKTVYCPSYCTKRNLSPNKIIIFPTLEEAAQAGYSLCRRCHPGQPEWKNAKQEVAELAKDYIEDHYTDKFSLDEIAGELFVNKIYLSKCFKEATGDTLLHYHNSVRCRHACELLSDSEFNIDMISSQVGYVTSSHFARTFRSFYQCSPVEYRKRYFEDME